MAQIIQQRNLVIYIVTAVTALGLLAWHHLPQSGLWRDLRRLLIAWLVAAEWIILVLR